MGAPGLCRLVMQDLGTAWDVQLDESEATAARVARRAARREKALQVRILSYSICVYRSTFHCVGEHAFSMTCLVVLRGMSAVCISCKVRSSN